MQLYTYDRCHRLSQFPNCSIFTLFLSDASNLSTVLSKLCAQCCKLSNKFGQYFQFCLILFICFDNYDLDTGQTLLYCNLWFFLFCLWSSLISPSLLAPASLAPILLRWSVQIGRCWMVKICGNTIIYCKLLCIFLAKISHKSAIK